MRYQTAGVLGETAKLGFNIYHISKERSVVKVWSKLLILQSFGWLPGTLLLALGGTEYFSFTHIQCECCSVQAPHKGKVCYLQAAVTPVIVAPNQWSMIPWVPEFITAQEGTEKQDSELAAAQRGLEREASRP